MLPRSLGMNERKLTCDRGDNSSIIGSMINSSSTIKDTVKVDIAESIDISEKKYALIESVKSVAPRFTNITSRSGCNIPMILLFPVYLGQNSDKHIIPSVAENDKSADTSNTEYGETKVMTRRDAKTERKASVFRPSIRPEIPTQHIMHALIVDTDAPVKTV